MPLGVRAPRRARSPRAPRRLPRLPLRADALRGRREASLCCVLRGPDVDVRASAAATRPHTASHPARGRRRRGRVAWSSFTPVPCRGVVLRTESTAVEYVLRSAEEHGVRFVRLWFVDVLGLLKSSSIPVSELEQALTEGVGLDGSSLDGAHAPFRARRDRTPRPDDLRRPALAARRGGRAHVLRHQASRRHTVARRLSRGPPPAAPESRGARLHVPGRARDRVLSLRRQARQRAAGAARRGLLLRPDPARRRQRLPPRDDPVPRAARDPGQSLTPRSRRVAARDGPEAHRRALDGRRDHDVPAHGQGGGARGRRVRDVHAEAGRRHSRLRACISTSRSSSRTPGSTRSTPRIRRHCSRPSVQRSSPAC